MYRSVYYRNIVFTLGVAIIATTSGMAGPLEPPAGPVTSTGRFGPRTDVLTLTGDATATRVISQPGSYYLSGPLLVGGGTVGIRIDANLVNLDLGGNFIIYNGAGTLDGILVNEGDMVSIHNGYLFGFGGSGIKILGGSNHTIRDVTVQGCSGWGMDFNSAPTPRNVTVIDSFVRLNSLGGISADSSLSVSNTQVTENSGPGIFVNALGNIFHNLVRNNSGAGISCNTGCLVRGNESQANAGGNISAGPQSTVVENNQ